MPCKCEKVSGITAPITKWRRGFRSPGLSVAGDLQRGGRNLGREETPVVCSEAAAMYCSGRWSTACWLLREQHKVGRRRGVAKGAGGSQREQKAQANRPHPSAMAHLHPGHGYQARLPPSRGRKGSARLPPAEKLSPSDLVRGLVASIGDGVARAPCPPHFFPTGSAARRPLLALCVWACLLPQTPRAGMGALARVLASIQMGQAHLEPRKISAKKIQPLHIFGKLRLNGLWPS